MDINIKFKHCKFFVDEEKRTVVCVIENTRNAFTDFINYNHLWDDSRDPVPPIHNDRSLRMPARFVGIAKCREGDEWNEALGKKIAYMKARHKFHTSFFKRANRYVNEVDSILANITNKLNLYGEKISMYMSAKQKEINEYFEKEEH